MYDVSDYRVGMKFKTQGGQVLEVVKIDGDYMTVRREEDNHEFLTTGCRFGFFLANWRAKEVL